MAIAEFCAPDKWAVDSMIEKILRRLQLMAPTNSAPITLTTALEEGTWHVDIMVRTDDAEWDIHTEHHNLRNALRAAYNNMANSKRQAQPRLD